MWSVLPGQWNSLAPSPFTVSVIGRSRASMAYSVDAPIVKRVPPAFVHSASFSLPSSPSPVSYSGG